MSRPLTNLLLLGLVLTLALTGLIGWIVPEPRSLVLYELHRVLGAALVVVLVWKYGIARRSLGRRLARRPRDPSVLAGLLAGAALLGSLGFALSWTLQLMSFDALWGYSPLNLHVQLGLLLLALMGWHLFGRPERPPATRDLLGRRNALRILGFAAASGLAWRGVDMIADSLAPTGSRRASGSKHAASFSGNAYPVTIWLFDGVPDLDAQTWQLAIGGNVAAPSVLSYDDLAALPTREVSTVLDCTGGWWSEQVWRGVAVEDVLAACGGATRARTGHVVSVTGHHWSFPLDELRGAILATHVGDESLTPGHGYPVRLVAPGRRGFQWVKWVARIEIA